MSRIQLRASLALWRRRLDYRQRRVDYHRGRAKSGAGAATKGVVTREEAALIHHWERLRDQARDMVERRTRQLEAHKPKASVRAQAVSFARSLAGKVREQPPGSNGGGLISQWEAALGFGRVPWCGIFCAAVLRHAGVKNVTARLAGVALIEEDAKAHRGCFRGWTTSTRGVMPGDLVVLFGYGVHVELVDHIAGGIVHTIGGNTSAGSSGSQANGGGVYRRQRPLSAVRGFALVNFPG